MNSKTSHRVTILGLLGAAALLAQDAPLSNSSVSINLPADGPVALLNISTGSSRTSAVGPQLLLDLNLSLTLRNISNNRIHGVTLRIVSQEGALGAVGSVSQPSLNVGPGEAFPVHITTKLMRPAQLAGGPLLQVNLDGVLFQDLGFYGEDKLHSRRTMIASEMEAQRDRLALKKLVAQGGDLKAAILKILQRQNDLPQLQGRIVRGHSITNAAVAAISPERQEKFALVQFPDSPVELRQGTVMVSGNEARTPSIEVANRTDRPVKYVEVGWILTDSSGKAYMAGSLPSSDPAFSLAAKATGQVRQENSLVFSTKGQSFNIRNVTGFVSQVEFADGKVWVPNRQSLESNALLQQVMAPSVEEQRLANLYVTKGLQALADELKK